MTDHPAPTDPRTASAVIDLGALRANLAAIGALMWRKRAQVTEGNVTFVPDDLPRDTLRRMARRAITTPSSRSSRRWRAAATA